MVVISERFQDSSMLKLRLFHNVTALSYHPVIGFWSQEFSKHNPSMQSSIWLWVNTLVSWLFTSHKWPCTALAVGMSTSPWPLVGPIPTSQKPSLWPTDVLQRVKPVVPAAEKETMVQWDEAQQRDHCARAPESAVMPYVLAVLLLGLEVTRFMILKR